MFLLCFSQAGQPLVDAGHDIVVAGGIVVAQTLQILPSLKILAPLLVDIGHKQEAPGQPVAVGSALVDKGIQGLLGIVERLVVKLYCASR